MKPTKMMYVCRSCGYYGRGVKKEKGSFRVGCILLLAGILTCGIFLIPWFIYEVWRFTTKGLTCPQCDSRDLIPANSPIGQKLIKEYGINTEDDIIRVNTKKKVETEDDWDD